MSTKKINISLTEHQLATAISGLLFSCSVNVVSNTNSEYQNDMFQLAKELKRVSPNIKLNDVQFLKETDYEDSISHELLSEFKANMEIITFEQI